MHTFTRTLLSTLLLLPTLLLASAQSIPSPTLLSNGQVISIPTMASKTTSTYSIQVPSGAKNLRFITTGTTGDADIYVKKGTIPTTKSYSWKSDGAKSNESILLAGPTLGTYNILLKAYSYVENVTLTVSYEGGDLSSLTPITSPVPVCTMDVKICPDGTTVSRTGTSCSFICAPLLTTTTPTTQGGVTTLATTATTGSSPTTGSHGVNFHQSGGSRGAAMDTPSMTT